MANKVTERITQDKLSKTVYQIFDITKKESAFIFMLAVLLFISGVISPYPGIAMWFGFGLAGYSAIANDSIQTIGTFIASNKQRKWYFLWLFIGLIFVGTVTFSWIVFDGDVSFQRLTSKGFSEAPQSFSFLQLSAPIFLLILTRMRMPVSTTFLLLNAFSTSTGAIVDVLQKSFYGYILAFITAIVVWFIVGAYVKNYFSKRPAPYWSWLQWVTSGALWSVWIQQDAANIAIFLPRSLDIFQFLAFTLFIFLGLGLLFYLRGDKIQEIVSEKSGVADVRAATIVDFIYAILLFYFKSISTIPISTTWVFIGLLGGRELAISFTKKRRKKMNKSLKASFHMVGKDLSYALIGLIISLILAIAINPNIREEVYNFLF
ncbi:hypothetical protein BH23BAC1_BH23BAC1_02630 [soil metagenome]